MEKLKDKATGRLYGVICDKTLIVVSFSINHEDENEPITSYNDLQLSMPVEVDFCGVLLVGDVEGNIPDAFKVLNYFYEYKCSNRLMLSLIV